MLGQLGKTPEGDQHPQIGRRKQLALACYGGKMNAQTFTYRTDWSEKLEEYFPEAAQGVWGLRFQISNGITIPPSTDLARIKQLAQARYDFGRPIYLPDNHRNQQLQALVFTHRDAERMTTEQISKLVLPEAQKIFDEVIDIDAVFRPGTY